MKYQTYSSFESHIRSSYPEHLSSSYLVVSPHRDEMLHILLKLAHLFQVKEAEAERLVWDVKEHPIEELIGSVSSPSLFSTMSVICYHDIQALSKDGMGKLSTLLHSLPSYAKLLLGASSLKSHPAFYSLNKKELVVLDFSQEKPWDREKRIIHWLNQVVSKEKKIIRPHDLDLLIASHGLNFSLLEKELLKVITYIGDREMITAQDIAEISVPSIMGTSWKLSEALVWEGKANLEKEMNVDPSLLYAMIGSVRYQLKMGWKIALLLEKKMPLASHFPSIREKSLMRYESLAKEKGALYFERGLSELYHLEHKSKSMTVSPLALWTSFTSHLCGFET